MAEDKIIAMLVDKSALNYVKMFHKYGSDNFYKFITVLQDNFFRSLPLRDFRGNNCVLWPAKLSFNIQQTKILWANLPQNSVQAAIEEIMATLAIESIDSERESVRKILAGAAPVGKNEEKAFGIKRGLEFIADTNNIINEYNLFTLYRLAVGDFNEPDNKLTNDNYYRHDAVYVVGSAVSHEGLAHQLLPDYMKSFIKFINTDDGLDHLQKSIVIHYYFVYLHPYFDGNGRMARLLQIWFLIQNGYPEVLFLPLSMMIEKNRKAYYKAMEQVSDNVKISGVTDISLFVDYYLKNVLAKFEQKQESIDIYSKFKNLLSDGGVTVKEKQLFEFVLSNYGLNEFTTKQLERDYGNAAYATIRSFVLKFEAYGLLQSFHYSNRPKYKILNR